MVWWSWWSWPCPVKKSPGCIYYNGISDDAQGPDLTAEQGVQCKSNDPLLDGKVLDCTVVHENPTFHVERRKGMHDSLPQNWIESTGLAY